MGVVQSKNNIRRVVLNYIELLNSSSLKTNTLEVKSANEGQMEERYKDQAKLYMSNMWKERNRQDIEYPSQES